MTQPPVPPPLRRGSDTRPAAGWEDGLRRLYGQVVDEPLPTEFDALMRRMERQLH